MLKCIRQVMLSVLLFGVLVALLGAARTMYSLVVWFRFITGV